MWRKSASYFELSLWPLALALLYFMPVEGAHWSLCPLNALGFPWCPGCGIGHSIHYYLHLDFARGWQEHYLGGFAVVVILYRIFRLFKTKFKQTPTVHGQQNL